MDPEIGRLPQPVEPDDHVLEPRTGRGAMGAEQAVPHDEEAPKFLFVSGCQAEWWIRCRSGVTKTQRMSRSRIGGERKFPWSGRCWSA